ncbi:Crp/Fnr family transcriptional regulator [Pedobacter sp. HMWF019]|uniref:Crp/Fnr family transcriptional regulator n=1 Tax=Pedobacter sp. HMWF019 TaxID=2056856 RepID=UPI001304DAA6|nr:Crp/Fnr family transcriptional regulator [Pedobacter sp. HMWF019]
MESLNTFLLIETFNRLVTLNEKEVEHINNIVDQRIFKKGQFLIFDGAIEAKTFFVNKGTLRTYVIDSNGIEHILSFSPKGWWAGDLRPFYTKTKSNIIIEAITDSEVLIIDQQQREALYKFSQTFETFFRILAEKAFINLQNRVLESLSLNAVERYQKFVERYPDALQALPQKQIAAFIGVTPEFLSKAKKNY